MKLSALSNALVPTYTFALPILLLTGCGGGGGDGGTEPDTTQLSRAEASSALEREVTGFTSDTSLSSASLGIYEDPQGNKARIDYVESLSNENITYNDNPDGEPGGVNCILPVPPSNEVAASEVSTDGCLPFEVTQVIQRSSQLTEETELASSEPEVQTFSCDTQGCESTGLSGFELEGEVSYVECATTQLSNLTESGRSSTWGLTDSEALSFGNDFTLDNCVAYRFPDSENGNSLDGRIEGNWNFADSVAPEISITDVSFVTTLEDGTPRDVGEVCVTAEAQDAVDGDVSPSLAFELQSLNGQLARDTTSENGDGAICLSLDGFGDVESRVAITAQDSLGNSASTTTASFTPDLNTTGAYQSGGGDINCSPDSTITLPSVIFAQDPQGDVTTQGFSIGQNGTFACPSTPQTLTYTAFQEDTFGAIKQSPAYTLTVEEFGCEPLCGPL